MTTTTFNGNRKIIKSIIVGMVYLNNGSKRAFLNYVSYFLARAYYYMRGEVKLAVCTACTPIHLVGEDARKGMADYLWNIQNDGAFAVVPLSKAA